MTFSSIPQSHLSNDTAGISGTSTLSHDIPQVTWVQPTLSAMATEASSRLARPQADRAGSRITLGDRQRLISLRRKGCVGTIYRVPTVTSANKSMDPVLLHQ